MMRKPQTKEERAKKRAEREARNQQAFRDHRRRLRDELRDKYRDVWPDTSKLRGRIEQIMRQLDPMWQNIHSDWELQIDIDEVRMVEYHWQQKMKSVCADRNPFVCSFALYSVPACQL
jgi:hypothetical protein